MAATSNFVDEVYDQFLICRLCSNPYKHPKVLTCLHTFCCECLENYYEMEEQERPYRFLLYNRAISCPICRQKSELPTGGVGRLPENFLVENLSNVIKKRMPSNDKKEEKYCEICRETDESGKQRIAVTKCLDCVKHLCDFCSELHKRTKVTQFHAIFDMQIERSVQCKTHHDEVVKYFCEPCDECVCILCAFHQHKDHEVSTIAEVLDKSKDSFCDMLKECCAKIEELKQQIEFIEQCDISLKRTEDRIRESATETIAALRQKEREMILNLKTLIGQTTLDLISQKDLIEENLNRLEKTYKLTSMVAETNNIELLIAKKDLKEQLFDILHNSKLEFGKKLAKNEIMFADKDYFEKVRTVVNNISLKDTQTAVITVETNSKIYNDNVEIIAEPSEDKQKKSFAVVKPTLSSDDKVNETEIKVVKSTGPTWQKAMLTIEVVQNIIPINHIVLKHCTKTSEVTFKDAFTEMPQIVTSDKSVATLNVSKIDRETATMPVMIMHKGVSTVTTGKADKSTITSAEVSNAYRNVANVKRQVTVSRGTNTTSMHSESEPKSTTSRGCSPITLETNGQILNSLNTNDTLPFPSVSNDTENTLIETNQPLHTYFEDTSNKYVPCVGENFNVKINSMFLKQNNSNGSYPSMNADNNLTNSKINGIVNGASTTENGVQVKSNGQVNDQLTFYPGQPLLNAPDEHHTNVDQFTSDITNGINVMSPNANFTPVGSLQKSLSMQTNQSLASINDGSDLLQQPQQFLQQTCQQLQQPQQQNTQEQQHLHVLSPQPLKPQPLQQQQQSQPILLQQANVSQPQTQQDLQQPKHIIIPRNNSTNKMSSMCTSSGSPTQMGSKIAFLSGKLQNQSDSRSQSMFSSLSRIAKPLSNHLGTSVSKVTDSNTTSAIPLNSHSLLSTPKLLTSGEELKTNTT